MRIYVKRLTINNYQKFFQNFENREGVEKLLQNNIEGGGRNMKKKYDNGVSIKIDRKTKALLDEYKTKIGVPNATAIRLAVTEFLKDKM